MATSIPLQPHGQRAAGAEAQKMRPTLAAVAGAKARDRIVGIRRRGEAAHQFALVAADLHPPVDDRRGRGQLIDMPMATPRAGQMTAEAGAKAVRAARAAAIDIAAGRQGTSVPSGERDCERRRETELDRVGAARGWNIGRSHLDSRKKSGGVISAI